jgi:zinc transport system substrate-binding protein
VQSGSAARLGAALDPVGSTIEAGPEAYAALLRGLAQSLAECLNGA